MNDINQSKRISNASRVIKRMEAKTLPIHMINRDTHKVLNEDINIKEKINKLLANIDFNSKYEKLIEEINSQFSHVKYNYCISGSKAWYNIFKDYYENNLLSKYEKSAIHNNNTCDHYYFINANNLSFIETIKQNILIILNKFILLINDDLNKQVKLKDICNDDNKQVQLLANIKEAKSKNILLFKDNTILFSLSLTINDIVPKLLAAPQPSVVPQPLAAPQSSVVPQPKKPRTKRKTQTELAEELARERREEHERTKKIALARSERAASIAAKRGLSLQQKGGKDPNIITEDILRFEINFRDIGDDFESKINELTIGDTHYLNIYGLYLFLQFTKYKFFIRRDSYNVFKIREHIYNKFILIDEYKTDALFTILELYNNIFSSIIINEYLYNELNKLALTSNPKIEEFINNTEANIIECLRPYINKTVLNINNDIKTLKFKNNYNSESLGKDISGIFIVGGDAIRRYDFNGSITKDIDSKIYIPAEFDIYENIENYNIINKCIYTNLFKLASYLICKRDIIFSDLQNSLENIFRHTNYNKYECKVSFKLKADNDDFLNFRFRQLPKGKFPVDLYSLDYRCIIEFEYLLPGSSIKNYIYNYDIPFIDIVLESSQDNNYQKYAVLSGSTQLPISSLDFLIQDLIKTYNNDIPSLLRFLSGKSNKDYDRFKLLIALSKRKESLFTLTNQSNVIIFTNPETINNNRLLDKITDFESDILSDIKVNYDNYMELFEYNYIYNHNIKKSLKQRVKSKILFDYEEDILNRKKTSIINASSRKGGTIDMYYKQYIFDKNVNFDYINKIENTYHTKSTNYQINIEERPNDIDNDIINIMTPLNQLLPSKIEEFKKNLFKKI
jgi:hypothetical protein